MAAPGGGGGDGPGAASLTEAALLRPRPRWRSCRRCSCCWYHSRPRAIISRPCSSTSCSCCSSLICFSCRTQARARSPRAHTSPTGTHRHAPCHPRAPRGTQQDRMACTGPCLELTTGPRAHPRSHTPPCTPALTHPGTNRSPCEPLHWEHSPAPPPGAGGSLGLPQPLHTASPREPSPLFMARGHSQRVGWPDVPGKQVGASAVPGRG